MAKKKRKARSPQSPGPSTPAAARLSHGAARFAAAALLALFLAHAVVFGMRAVLAERRESTDAMNYISVARNLSAGEGFVQSSPGHNQPRFWDTQFDPDFPPKTRHSHSIGLPLLIFAVSELTGLEHADAAHVVNASSYGLALALAAALAFYLWGAGAALLAVAAISWLNNSLFYYPMSEPSAIVFAFASLLALAAFRGNWRFVAAGALAACAVLIRSAMLPIFGAGVLACLLQGQKRWRALALFSAGCAVFFAERFVGEGTRYVAFHTGVPWDSKIGIIFGQFFRALGPGLAILAALAFALLPQWKKMRAKFKSGLFPAFWGWVGENARRLPLAAWVAGFSASTLTAGIVLHIEHLDDFRELYPAKIAMAALIAGMAWSALAAWRWRIILAAGLFAFSMAAGIARDWKAFAARGDVSDAARIAASERLQWGAENLREDDFIVALFGVVYPYYLKQVESAASFIFWPYHSPVAAEHLDAVVRRRCGKHGRHLLIAPAQPHNYGPYMANLVARRPTPNMELIAALKDATVYRMTHCDQG